MTYIVAFFVAFWLLTAVVCIALIFHAVLAWLAEAWAPTPAPLRPGWIERATDEQVAAVAVEYARDQARVPRQRGRS